MGTTTYVDRGAEEELHDHILQREDRRSHNLDYFLPSRICLEGTAQSEWFEACPEDLGL